MDKIDGLCTEAPLDLYARAGVFYATATIACKRVF